MDVSIMKTCVKEWVESEALKVLHNERCWETNYMYIKVEIEMRKTVLHYVVLAFSSSDICILGFHHQFLTR